MASVSQIGLFILLLFKNHLERSLRDLEIKIKKNNPDTICAMIGETQLVEWNSAVVRFRTINIRKEWRNQNLGWCLLEESFNQDWSDHMSMFGWLKINKLNWAQNLGFTTIGDEKDNHIGVIREMRK